MTHKQKPDKTEEMYIPLFAGNFIIHTKWSKNKFKKFHDYKFQALFMKKVRNYISLGYSGMKESEKIKKLLES